MIPFTRFAYFTVARDSSFVALAAVTLMIGFSFEPALAFKAGATVFLAFSLGLLALVAGPAPGDLPPAHHFVSAGNSEIALK